MHVNMFLLLVAPFLVFCLLVLGIRLWKFPPLGDSKISTVGNSNPEEKRWKRRSVFYKIRSPNSEKLNSLLTTEEHEIRKKAEDVQKLCKKGVRENCHGMNEHGEDSLSFLKDSPGSTASKNIKVSLNNFSNTVRGLEIRLVQHSSGRVIVVYKKK